MKKLVALCMAVLMVFGVMLATPLIAFAEPEDSPSTSPSPTPVENVNLSIESYSPTSMTTGGDVKVRIVVKNNGTAVEGASLSIGGSNVATYGTIGAGETKTYDNTYSLPTSMLDKNVEVVLNYTFNGAQKSKSSSFKVSKKAANVGVSTSVKADQANVASGTKVKFSFSVENTGDVKIENAVIKDPELNGGNALNTAFSLSPGKSTVVTYTATITETTSISPTLSYRADGANQTKNMGSVTVTVSEADVSVVATADTTEPESGKDVVFTITITNSGGVNLSNLKLQDVLGNTVPLSSNTLAAGANVTAKYTTSFTENAEYSFTLTGVSDDGKEHSFESNVIPINIQTVEVDYSDILSLIVTADLKEYKKKGTVEFTMTLKNTGDITFTGVTISEENIGVLDTNIDTFGPGEKEYKAVAEIKEDGTYTFEAQMMDPDGNVVLVTSNPVEVKEEEKAGSGLTTLLWVIGIIVVLMIAAGVTLLVLKRKEKKEREAMEASKGSRVSRRNPNSRAQANTEEQAQAVRERKERPRPPATYDEMEPEEEIPSYEDYYPQNNTDVPVEEQAPTSYDDFDGDDANMPKEEPPVEPTPEPPAKKVKRRPDITDRNNF